MATDDPIRASDVDREAVVGALRDAYTAGRLTMEEFDERVSAAYASKTWGDLRQLTIDLPSQPILGTDVPSRRMSPDDGLPVHPPRPAAALVPDPGAKPPQPRRRGSPIGLLVPLAIWVLLVAHGTIEPGLVFLVVAIFALTAIASGIRRR